jgi:hypothetical protein
MSLPLHNITAYGTRRTHEAVVRIVEECRTIDDDWLATSPSFVPRVARGALSGPLAARIRAWA